MRTWARAPKVGVAIGQINMSFILPLSVLAMAMLSSYWWAGFPFDNLCENDIIDDKYVGLHFVETPNQNSSEPHVVEDNTIAYQYCNQNLIYPEGGQIRFPALPFWQYTTATGPWMTRDQELVTQVFGWTSVGVLVLLFLRYAWNTMKYLVRFVKATYEPRGEDKGINFSSVQGISCYIPQVVSGEFSYPLIASCIDDVETELIEWKDPDKSHVLYNVMEDAKKIMFGEDSNKELPINAFSRVYHYPPNREPSAHSAP